MRIGIDLLWVRPGICGGTESYIRNLMDGFGKFDSVNEYLLFVTQDNEDSFAGYANYPQMELAVCNTLCASQAKRILWENLHLDRTARARKIDLMFIPVYSKPFTGRRCPIPYVSVIHDLQALHYPQYFSWARRMFQKFMWRHACMTSRRVIAISEYCRRDLILHFPSVEKKSLVIYNPVVTTDSELPFNELEEKYHIKKDCYLYCVSSMLPHKNLSTLLKAMAALREYDFNMPLVLSGVGGERDKFVAVAKELGVQDRVIDTGYVSDRERDCLYENCKLFLFPSVFEGFGMPPVEAMRRGKNVVMTRESCLEEVTRGKAVYVDKPYDPEEWCDRIRYALTLQGNKYVFPEYETEWVVKEYLKTFRDCLGKGGAG